MTVGMSLEATRKESDPSVGQDVLRRMSHWGATEVFDVYWRFAAERQAVFLRRLQGAPAPWSSDPILETYRFTNPYRLSDRVSQYLMRHVQYDEDRSPSDVVLRTLLFKFFNRIDTWESVVAAAGQPTGDSFDPDVIADVLSALRSSGRRIYSPAYILPNPPFGAPTKHQNHLRLLTFMLDRGIIDQIAERTDLGELYESLLALPSLGPFLAFQAAVDINYSNVTAADEGGFVVPGPGARDGLRKCFARLPAGAEAEAIMWVARTQDVHFRRLDLRFDRILGRPLQPIDCQNLFCEVDKYARISHPHVPGRSRRTRIKQQFSSDGRDPLEPLFMPPKWRNAMTGGLVAPCHYPAR